MKDEEPKLCDVAGNTLAMCARVLTNGQLQFILHPFQISIICLQVEGFDGAAAAGGGGGGCGGGLGGADI
jgi:hypothetical protein